MITPLRIFLFLLLSLYFLTAGCNQYSPKEITGSWQEIEDNARGRTVNMMMWQGDASINTYMSQFVAPALKERFGIKLNIVSGQGNTIVSVLMGELEAGKRNSELDLVWINGETFYQLRQIDALAGPFVQLLPNAALLRDNDPFVMKDFQQPTNGMEAPWGSVQWVMITDTVRIPNPPDNARKLAGYIKQNPGTFTIPADFTGITFLKILLNDLSGGVLATNNLNEELYKLHSQKVWGWIREVKPYFWKNGETFPSELAHMHRMFAAGELHFSMSNNQADAANKITEGVFRESAKAYIWETGTIRNSHFLGIPKHSPNKNASLVTINFLMSPEAQYQKALPEVWGDGSVLDFESLPEEWKTKFAAIERQSATPSSSELLGNALEEPEAKWMIRLFDDFKTHIIQSDR